MTNIVSVSTTELGNRRRQLRRQRRLKLVQVFWQTLAVGSLAGGVIWAIGQPIWLIRQPEQVNVEGNYLLSDRTIRSSLPLSYPQSIWQIQPRAIEKTLMRENPIEDAIVIRQVFPPRLTIEVTERQPVAIAQSATALNRKGGDGDLGWLDAEGNWIPFSSYTELKQTDQLPNLKVVGSVEQYRPHWKQLYETLSRSPVDVSEIDWQDPANIILMTEIGEVHLGSYGSRFSEQLQALDRMRKLPEQLDVRQIDYIDLKNPGSPLVLMVSESRSESFPSNPESTSD
ncbi:MAG: cell division protein FtsQ/DivIB [Limnospira sp.]